MDLEVVYTSKQGEHRRHAEVSGHGMPGRWEFTYHMMTDRKRLLMRREGR